MSEMCQKCGAKCCKYFCFQIDEPDCYEEFEDVRWYLCHKGVSVHIDEGDWYISIENRCINLRRDDTCKMYDNRPTICRKYDTENCDQTGGDYGYDEEFKTPDEVEAYARKTLGEAKFERDRAKMRAKLGGATKKTKKIKKTKKSKSSAKRRKS